MDPENPVTTEALAVGVRTAPGAVMSVLTFNGVIALLTIVFLMVQIGYMLWRWRREWRHAQANRQMTEAARGDDE